MRLSKSAVFAVIVLSSLSGMAAQRTFVSGGGSDGSPCTRDMPCRSFAAAIAMTNPNGEVIALDSAGYGPFTIGQAVSVIAAPGAHAGISVISGDGVTVNANATDTVTLRGLYINAQGGPSGIRLTSAGTVHIEHCLVSGFAGSNIILTPVGSANVVISDTISRDAGSFGVYADSAQPLNISIGRCRMQRSYGGVLVDRATVC